MQSCGELRACRNCCSASRSGSEWSLCLNLRRLDCTSLSAGDLLCTGVSATATCGNRVFMTSGSDTCLSIRTAFGANGAPIPFALFGALNNGALAVGVVTKLPSLLELFFFDRRQQKHLCLFTTLADDSSIVLMHDDDQLFEYELLYAVHVASVVHGSGSIVKSVVPPVIYSPLQALCHWKTGDPNLNQLATQAHASGAGLDCGPDGTTPLPANLVLCLPVLLGGSASAPAAAPSILTRRRLAAAVSVAGPSMAGSAGAMLVPLAGGTIGPNFIPPPPLLPQP